MANERCRDLLEGGHSVLVGAVDAEGIPSCCRGVALASNDGLATATVYVPAATSHEIIANVATTRRVAVLVSHPISHNSVQFKGTTRGVRMAGESERMLIRERIDQFAAIIETLGLPPRITRSVVYWPAFAIDFDVVETFDQTPGPNAGAAL